MRTPESMNSVTRLTDLESDELTALLVAAGQKNFRAKQVAEWIFKRSVVDVESMLNLPADLRSWLRERFPARPLHVEKKSVAADGTEKLLFRLGDDRFIESVYIPTEKRVTICLSSQVGCAVQCRFCASGIDGGKRNLSRGEILEQYLTMQRLAASHDRHITNLVMMGMGEPMFNYANVFSALGTINSEDGPNLGARKITVSTIGIRKGVERFTEARTQYTLAFSLHAPNDDLRREIVPLEEAMSVDEIRDAAMRYLGQTGREVTFEYVLLDGVNASIEHARELVARFRKVRGTVNLIPYNPVAGLPYRRPTDATIDAFARTVEQSSLKVSVRRRRGADIDAACGQLAHRARTER